MCLAIPVRVEQVLDDDQALVELNGVQTRISTALVENIAVGDYVILHVGYALTKLEPDEAEARLALFSGQDAVIADDDIDSNLAPDTLS